MSMKYVCQSCSEVFSTWSGKCASCGSWSSLIEQEVASAKSGGASAQELTSEPIRSINTNVKKLDRYDTGFANINEVLGGGIVKGGITMLAGQPGIGKSTLLMQIVGNLDTKDQNILYVTGEESVEQVADRAKRLKVKNKDIKLASTSSADAIAAAVLKDKPEVCIVDSIQTVKIDRLVSMPGTISQVTNSIHLLSQACHKTGTTLIVIGHVTKEGAIAGPKLLEHLVDVVLYIEGDRYEDLRILRSSKNRFGSTLESALLSMDSGGLKIAEDVSRALIEQRTDADGSVIAAVVEGSQPLLVEVQALATESSFGYPKRTASGFDLNRLNILIAVLSKRTNLKVADKDIFINIAGGVSTKDPGLDLAVCIAIASVLTDYKIKEDVAVFGEVGLGGEIRRTQFTEKRVKEANKYNFKTIIGPQNSAKLKDYHEVSSLRDTLVRYLKK